MHKVTLSQLLALGTHGEYQALTAQPTSILAGIRGDLHNALAAIEADETRSSAERVLTTASAVKGASLRARAAMDKASADLRRQLLRAETDSLATFAASSPAQEIRNGQIRDSLKQLPLPERTSTIRMAIINGDESVMRAVASAPAFASGALGISHTDCFEALCKAANPSAYEQRGNLKAAVEFLENAGATFEKEANQLVDHREVENVREARIRATEALAKVAGNSNA